VLDLLKEQVSYDVKP